VNYWKVNIATVVIFGAGVFTGGLLINSVQHSHSKNPRHAEAASSATNSILPTNPPGVMAAVARLPDVLSKPFLPKLDDRLHLSVEQHKAIEKIIAEGQGQMRKLMHDTRLEIRGQLTPEQREQFDALIKPPGKRPALTNGVVPANNSRPDAPTNAP
jgi:cell division protein FtsN